MKTDTNIHYLSVEQVANVFGVEESTVREWAKKGELPAKKVGKQWFFSRNSTYEHQSIQDTLSLIGGRIGFTTEYDWLAGDKRVEVKSCNLRTSKKLGVYWQFTNFHPSSMSDNYLLLGYSPDRTELLVAIYIPSKVLEDYLPKIVTKGRKYRMEEKALSDLDGRSFNVNTEDNFFYQYIIYTNQKGGEKINA